ncbi:solute carrier family 2, facilitated glucose transporter member 8-like isoform X2 [Glandiceps talaboti]
MIRGNAQLTVIIMESIQGTEHSEIHIPLMGSGRVVNRNLYIATAVAVLGSLSFGYTLGYTSSANPDMKDKGILDDNTASWFGAVVALGAMIGGPIAGWLVEFGGRKLCVMASALPFVIGWLCISISHGILSLLMIGRILTGIAAGMCSLAVPVYIAETSTPSLRGFLGACFQVAVTLGILFAYLVGMAGLNYVWLALVGAMIPTLMIILMIFMPETPRYLLSKNKRNDALGALTYLRGSYIDVDEECCEIESNLDQQEDMSMSEFLRPSLYKPLIVSVMLMIFQQFSGINAVMFYTVDIFHSAGFTDGHLATVIVGAVQVVFTILAASIMDRAGRRILLIVAGTGMTISSVTFGLYYQLSDSSASNSTLATLATASSSSSNLNWLSLTSMIVYIISFSLGWGAIPWLVMSEIFPSRARGVASGIATLVNWTCAFIVTLTFVHMSDAMSNQGVFWFFAGVCFLGIVFVFFIVPETKGRSLEEIEAYFEGRSPSTEEF